MSRFICLAVLTLPSIVVAADTTKAVQQIAERKLKFGPGLNTQFEGLALALLGSCTAENDAKIACKERWDKAQKGDHLLVAFAKPRVISVGGGEDPEATVLEILIPIGPYDSPDHLFIRHGERYRAFAKYDHEICSTLQKHLRRFLPLPAVKKPGQ